MLEIKNLHAEVDGAEILKGVDLKINPGEVHAIMGPNGSGKSTLANVVMGNPVYEVTEGSVIFEGEDITEEPVDNRAKLGMFLAFQYPESIPGVTIVNMLKTALSNIEEIRSIPRGFGSYGDMVLILNDGSKVEMKSLPLFREKQKFIEENINKRSQIPNLNEVEGFATKS